MPAVGPGAVPSTPDGGDDNGGKRAEVGRRADARDARAQQRDARAGRRDDAAEQRAASGARDAAVDDADRVHAAADREHAARDRDRAAGDRDDLTTPEVPAQPTAEHGDALGTRSSTVAALAAGAMAEHQQARAAYESAMKDASRARTVLARAERAHLDAALAEMHADDAERARPLPPQDAS